MEVPEEGVLLRERQPFSEQSQALNSDNATASSKSRPAYGLGWTIVDLTVVAVSGTGEARIFTKDLQEKMDYFSACEQSFHPHSAICHGNLHKDLAFLVALVRNDSPFQISNDGVRNRSMVKM